MIKVLPKADPGTTDTFSKIMRRDPVTGKTYVNIVELYQMRKQANKSFENILNQHKTQTE